MRFLYIVAFLLSTTVFGVDDQYSFNEILPETLSLEVSSYLVDTDKVIVRTVNKSLWRFYKPWSSEKNRQGFLVKKPGIGFVFAPDEIQNNKIEDLNWLWKEESVDAATTGIEPAYLKTLTNIYKKEVDEFVAKIVHKKNYSKKEWKELGGKLFITLSAVTKTLQDANRNSEAYTTKYVNRAICLTWKSSMGISQSATNTAIIGIDWRPTTEGLDWLVASELGKYTAWYAAVDAGIDIVRTMSRASKSAVLSAAEEAVFMKKSQQNISRVAYRTAEKNALLYLIKHAKSDDDGGLLEKTYNAIKNTNVLSREDSTFSSQTHWTEFKNKHFSGLSDDDIHFIQPTLDHIDQIVKKIESLPADD